MTTPKEQYNAKIKKIDLKVQALEEANQADIHRIPELEKEYQQKIDAIEIERADAIHAEIDRLKRSAEIRGTQIKMLKDKNHPSRVAAKDEYLSALMEEKERIIEAHRTQHEKVLAAREEYMRLAISTLPLFNEFHDNAREYHAAEKPGFPMLYPSGIAGGPANYQVFEGELFKMAEKLSKEAAEQV
ncbi:MAG: hypothetical protein ACQEV0_16015 [Bacillota bacterium]